MRLTYLAIVLIVVAGCAKKQQTPDAKKPVPAAVTPSDPQPQSTEAPPPPAPASNAAPAPGSRGPVKKGGDPQDGGE